MFTYHHHQPSTTQLNLTSYYREAGDLLTPSQIEQINQARSILVKFLDKDQTVPQNLDKTILAIKEYLPYLNKLLRTVESDRQGACVKGVIAWPWKPILGKKRSKIEYASIYYELGNTLMALAFSLMNKATGLVESIMNESNSFSGDVGEGANSEDQQPSPNNDSIFNTASHLFLEAAGICTYWHTTGMQKWVNLPSERPPELMKSIAKALTQISLAESQRIVIFKALQTTPPKVSYTTLSKLTAQLIIYWETAGKYLRETRHDFEDLNTDFVEFVEWMGNRYTPALLRRVLALDSYQQNRIGEAIGCLNDAVSILQTHDQTPAECRGIWKAEMRGIQSLVSMYTKVNDTVYFDKVMSKEDVHLKIRTTVTAKVFVEEKVFVMPHFYSNN